jgi:DNA-binding beta-propeller fold protein YncE
MYIASCPGVAAAAPTCPGRSRRRLAALVFAILISATSALPAFAQTYVTQYNDAVGPVGEALDSVGGVTYLYVADEAHGNVIKIDVATGATVATFGAGNQGNAPGQFGRPYGIAVDPTSHDLYVAERLNGRVQRINSTTGASIMMWGVNDAAFDSTGRNTNAPNPTSPQGHFQEPIGVAADSAGNVYVVDHGNDRVQKFLVHQVNGAWTADNVTMWGTSGSGNGQFNHPYGAALDSAGNLWVADGQNGRVQKFGPTGTYLGSAGSAGTGPGQFVIATWVNFDPTGALYVTSTNSDPQNGGLADANSQWISKFTPSGSGATFVARFGGTYGTNPGEFRLPFDVVVDATNKAYVTDYYNSRVQVFDLAAAPTGGTSGGSTSGGSTSGGTSTGGTTSGGTTTGGTSTGGTSTGGSSSGGTSSGGTSSGGTSTGGTSTGGNGSGSGPASTVNVVSVTAPTAGHYRAGDALVFTVTFNARVAVSAPHFAADENKAGKSKGKGNGNGKGKGNSDGNDGGDDESKGDHSAGPASGGDDNSNDDGATDSLDDAAAPRIGWTAVGANGGPGHSGAAAYVSGSGSTQLTFKYQVHGNDDAPAGISLGTALELPHGSAIVDAAGNALGVAQLTLPWDQNPLTDVILVPANVSNHGSDVRAGGPGGKKDEPPPTTGGADNGKGKSSRDAKLVNLSSRLRVDGKDANHVVVVGFVVSGDAPQWVLVRAVGPGLRAFGITDALADPTLRIQNGAGQLLAENGGWGGDAQVSAVTQRVGAFALVSGSHDAAVLVNLAPGAYTATVLGGKGEVLIEVYDATTGATLTSPQLVNISTRGFVDTNGSLIAGFVVSGTSPKRVLVRAVGPGLAAFGLASALSDPVLEVHRGSGATVATNDDWGTPVTVDAAHPAASAAEIVTANASVGAFPLNAGSKDAAMVVTLDPGSYSAVVTGAGKSSGAVLVEVYELP